MFTEKNHDYHNIITIPMVNAMKKKYKLKLSFIKNNIYTTKRIYNRTLFFSIEWRPIDVSFFLQHYKYIIIKKNISLIEIKNSYEEIITDAALYSMLNRPKTRVKYMQLSIANLYFILELRDDSIKM